MGTSTVGEYQDTTKGFTVAKQAALLALLAEPSYLNYADVAAVYYALTPVELGECLFFIATRNQYEEVEYFLRIRPDVDLNATVNAAGDTVMHIVMRAPTLDFSLVDLFLQKNVSLEKKNHLLVSPLQQCFAQIDGENIIQEYLNRYGETFSLALIQEIFEEASRRHLSNLSFYLLTQFAGRLDVKATLDTLTGDRIIHSAAQSSPLDDGLLYELMHQGASWQDKQNKAEQRMAKTPLDLVLASNDYDRIIHVATEFAGQLTIGQHFQVQSWLFLKDISLCEKLLITQHKSSHLEPEYFIKTLEALKHANSRLSIAGMKTILSNLIETQGNDLSLLMYMLNTNGDQAAQKQALSDLVRQMLRNLREPESVMALVNSLDAMTRRTGNPGIAFLRERTQVSLHGHAWKGEPACGTWVSLMLTAQARVKELSGKVMTEEAKQFVSLSTSQRFGLFTKSVSSVALDNTSPSFNPITGSPLVSPLH